VDVISHQSHQVSQTVVLEVAGTPILEEWDDDRRIGLQGKIGPCFNEMPQHLAGVPTIVGVRNEKDHSAQGKVRVLSKLGDGIDFGPAPAGGGIEYGKLVAKLPPPTALERVLECHRVGRRRTQPIDLSEVPVEQARPDGAEQGVWFWFHEVAFAGY
jgi:hypothetical protein